MKGFQLQCKFSCTAFFKHISVLLFLGEQTADREDYPSIFMSKPSRTAMRPSKKSRWQDSIRATSPPPPCASQLAHRVNFPVCDCSLSIIGTYYVQSLITTGREGLGFKLKYDSRARSLKPGTTLARVIMTMNEGTRQKQDHSASEGRWERTLC